MRRAALEEPGAGHPEAERPPQVEEDPHLQRLAWASAVGSHAVQRMARERGSVVARQPTKPKPKPRPKRKGPAPTSDDVADVTRVGKRVIGQIPQLERERVISSAYAEELKRGIEGFIARAKQRRPGEQAQIRKDLRGLRAHVDELRKRSAEARSTKGKTLVSDFKVTPPVIRIDKGEAARISFVLADKVKSVNAMIVVHERDPGDDREADRTWMRTFQIGTKPGYHQAIWDGTLKGLANEPPKTGTYALEITVNGEQHQERLIEHIRVENPNDDTVLPRLESGREVASLTFDGRKLVLADSGGSTIEAEATSGLKKHHKKNPDGKDYTLPEHQWVEKRGPIPAGDYVLKPGNFQVPDADPKGQTYASQGTAAKWGPMRVQIEPNVVKNRSEFFLHMDVTNDGTAGCIGLPPAEEGRFNQMMSLIARSKKDIKLVVRY